MSETEVHEEWFEDDGFWEEMRGLMFDSRRLEGTPTEVDRIQALLELKPGAAVLDMPCGFGRHSLELARRGHAVTGVDLSPSYQAHLVGAVADAEAEVGVGALPGSVEAVRADMREFRRPGAYDAALNLYSSFGYFADPRDDWRVLENLLASLKPGGILLMEMMSKEILARDFQPRRFDERDGAIVLERTRILDNWRTCETSWTVIRGDERRDRTFRTRLYSAAVLEGTLARVGFAGTAVYGNLWAAPYDHRAERMVVLAQAPGQEKS